MHRVCDPIYPIKTTCLIIRLANRSNFRNEKKNGAFLSSILTFTQSEVVMIWWCYVGGWVTLGHCIEQQPIAISTTNTSHTHSINFLSFAFVYKFFGCSHFPKSITISQPYEPAFWPLFLSSFHHHHRQLQKKNADESVERVLPPLLLLIEEETTGVFIQLLSRIIDLSSSQ